MRISEWEKIQWKFIIYQMKEVKVFYFENWKTLLRELSREVCGKQTQYHQNVCSPQIKKQVQWNPNQNLAGFYEPNKKQWKFILQFLKYKVSTIVKTIMKSKSKVGGLNYLI